MSDETRTPEELGPRAETDGAATRGERRDDAGATRSKRPDETPSARAMHAVREFVIVVGLALILSLAVKTWLMQAFFIPSGSMENTLVRGDRVVVSKLTPKPFSLERGDIVVFQDSGHWLPPAAEPPRTGVSKALHDSLVFVGLLPNDSDSHLIKRVIGVPGDKVKCCTTDGKVTVNGAKITEPYLKPGDAPSAEDFDITVPEGRVWVMGDHRSDSGDSRFHDPKRDGSQGSIPISDVVGRAVAVVWPLDHVTWLGQPTQVYSSVPSPK